MLFFILLFVFIPFVCYTMDKRITSIKKAGKRVSSDSKALHTNSRKLQLKKRKSLAQLSPRNDFNHVMNLIKHNGTTLTPRHINPNTSQMSGSNGNTLLHKAAQFEQYSLIKILVMNGANTKSKNKDGNTPLHVSVANNHLMFTRMLIQLGDKKPDIDAQNNNGDTALHIATRNGNIHCIKLLLLAYANPHIKNNTGETAKKIAKKIRKRYPTLKKINFEQTTLKSNLQKYKQIERTFNDLLEIIQNNKVKNAKKYIKKIPINWSNNSGNTALHTAALFKRYEIIAMLLINGADPNQTNNLGENALHHLLNNPPSDKKGTKHCINCIQLFLNHDVNITAQTNMNMTALQLARIHKNKTIIAFLEKKIKDLQPIKLRNTVDKT